MYNTITIICNEFVVIKILLKYDFVQPPKSHLLENSVIREPKTEDNKLFVKNVIVADWSAASGINYKFYTRQMSAAGSYKLNNSPVGSRHTAPDHLSRGLLTAIALPLITISLIIEIYLYLSTSISDFFSLFSTPLKYSTSF